VFPLPFPLIYLKISLVVIALIAIVGLYWWISGTFAERDRLKISEAVKTVQIQQYQEAMAANIKLNEDINNAISKIRVTSNNYIRSVDTGKAPDVPDGTRIQLVAGGLPSSSGMPTFANYSTNGGGSVPEAD
jgi:type II secretory pathway pseudopilin PulG